MCNGEICENLGLCYCVGHLSHFDNLEKDMIQVPQGFIDGEEEEEEEEKN